MIKQFLNTLLPILICGYNLSAQTNIIEMETVLTIGNDETLAKEYLFARPRLISIDSDYNIYLADANMSSIRVFDRFGKFLISIGKKGQGPGEIQDLTSMTVDQQNNLITVDRLNRRITSFKGIGKSFQTFPMIDKSFIDVHFIGQNSTGDYILYYFLRKKTKDTSKFKKTIGDFVLHIYNSDFSAIKESFADAREIWDFNNDFEKLLPTISINKKILILNDSQVILTRGLYNGKLYVYRKEKGKDWKLNFFIGKVTDHMPYKLEDAPSKFLSMRVNKLKNKFVSMRNFSKGLFLLSDGRIVHFSVLDFGEDGVIWGVELFNSNGKYLGYGEIENIQNRTRVFHLNVLAIDKNDNFYLSDLEEYPVVKVAKFDFSTGFSIK